MTDLRLPQDAHELAHAHATGDPLAGSRRSG